MTATNSNTTGDAVGVADAAACDVGAAPACDAGGTATDEATVSLCPPAAAWQANSNTHPHARPPIDILIGSS